MKNFKFNARTSLTVLGAGMLFCLCFFFSCEKDVLQPETVMENEGNNKVLFRESGDGVVDYTVAESILDGVLYGEISVDENLSALNFGSDDVLRNTLELIEEANLALASEINSSIAGLSDDEIDAMDINDDFASEVFEGNFPNFNSLRAMIADLEEAFYANFDLDDEADPADTYDAIPNILRTVMNTYGEVVFQNSEGLADQIHISRIDGGNYTITDGDVETALQIRDGLPHDEIAMKRAVTLEDFPNDDGGNLGTSAGEPSTEIRCDGSRTVKLTRYYNPSGIYSYRAKMKVGVRNASLWGIHRAYSELISHVSENNGRWKRHDTGITIDQLGDVYFSTYTPYDCSYLAQDSNGDVIWIQRTCQSENPCVGDAISAVNNDFEIDWKFRVEEDYNSKVSASNKDGAPAVLRAEFSWKGQTYNLNIF